MIKMSVMHPNSPHSKFDADYYCATHIPLAAELLGDALKSSSVDIGLAGAAPGEAAAFIAIGHLSFDSMESCQQAFGAAAEKLMADLPNYTDVQPQIQFSEIRA